MPDGFHIPEVLETARYRLRPLAEQHTKLDYDAVMETRERLMAGAPNGWPRDGFTLEENRSDLVRHEQEFKERIAFAYTVLSLDETEVLGCVYLNPPDADTADVAVHMWVREREYASGLALHLHRYVADWLKQKWPFTRISFKRPDYYFAKGQCLCGAVQFYAGPITGPFELCHCSRCRRTTGSGYLATLFAGEVRFQQGRDLIRIAELPILNQPPAYRRSFCDSCGSLLPIPDIDGRQEIPAGTLQPLDLLPDRHIFVENAPEWTFSVESLPRLTGAEIRGLRENTGS